MLYSLKNGKSLIIREAEEKDAAEIVEVSGRIGGETDNLTFGIDDFYFTEDEERIFIKNIRERDNCLFIVAVVDGKIVGTLNFVAPQRRRLMHRGDIGLYILKEHYGVGIGSCLIEYFLNWAELNGKIKKVDLQVREDNERAIHLYEKHGFKIEGIITRGLYIEGRYYNIYYMGKTIGQVSL